MSKSPIDAALEAGNKPSPRRAPIRQDTRTIEIPVDHNPGTVTGDGISAQNARRAMAAIEQSWVHIRDAAADPEIDKPRLAMAAQGAMEKALTQADTMAANIETNLANIAGEIEGRIRPKVDPHLAAEIRSHFKHEGWDKGLISAVQESPQVASAILSAPRFLSGLDNKKIDLVRTAAVKAHALDLEQQQVEAAAAHEKVTTAAKRMLEVVAPRLTVWAEPDNSNLTALEEYSRDK